MSQPVNNKLLTLICLTLLTAYATAFSILSVRNYQLYQTFAWDLGFFDQLLWQASRGNFNFVSTIGNINILGDHFQPVIYLLAPLYWLWDDVRVILIAQALLVTLAAIPLYYLAKFKLKHEFLALSISISYLLFGGTQFTITNEFHQSAFTPLLLSLGLYWVETGRTRRGFAALASLMFVKEELALLVGALGVMYLIKRQAKLGILLFVTGITSFYLLINWVIPVLSSQGRYIHYGFGTLGSTPGKVIQSIVNNPTSSLKHLITPRVKINQVVMSLISLGGLPVFSPVSLIPVAQQYAVRFLDDQNSHRWLNNNHYTAPLGPLLAYGAVMALEKIGRMRSFHLMSLRRASLQVTWQSLFTVYLLFASLGSVVWLHLPILSLFKSQLYYTPQWVRDIDEAVKVVPREAAVVANNSVVSHLSRRDKIYPLPRFSDAQFVVIDLSPGPNKHTKYQLDQMKSRLENEMGEKIWCEHFSQDAALVLRKCDWQL